MARLMTGLWTSEVASKMVQVVDRATKCRVRCPTRDVKSHGATATHHLRPQLPAARRAPSAPARQLATVWPMSMTGYEARPGPPPVNRIWTDDGVCAFYGVSSDADAIRPTTSNTSSCLPSGVSGKPASPSGVGVELRRRLGRHRSWRCRI